MEPHILDLCSIAEKNISKENIKTIFDVGSRDLEESIYFAERYPNAKIYSFECNPRTISTCIERQKKYSNIFFFSEAVNNYTGTCKFYPTDPEKTITPHPDGNQGASSLFKANGNYTLETYIQKEIVVPCTRLDDVIKKHNIDKIDILWMDLQGAELLALQSLGDYLDKISFICTEVEMNPIYENQCLFKDVDNFLNKKFEKVYGDLNTHWGTNIIYKNYEI